jgi:GNAT superfamily N-acetyltransferase
MRGEVPVLTITTFCGAARARLSSAFRSKYLAAAAPGRLWIRTAAARDVDCLVAYFDTLSCSSRYDRFMGGVSSFSRIAQDCLIHGRNGDRFTIVAELRGKSGNSIIGEASYDYDRAANCGEFAISVSDLWQSQGLGSALLGALQFRAISLGHFELFGETLKTNDRMKGLARKAGFAFSRSLDWRAARFDKTLKTRTP